MISCGFIYSFRKLFPNNFTLNEREVRVGGGMGREGGKEKKEKEGKKEKERREGGGRQEK